MSLIFRLNLSTTSTPSQWRETDFGDEELATGVKFNMASLDPNPWDINLSAIMCAEVQVNDQISSVHKNADVQIVDVEEQEPLNWDSISAIDSLNLPTLTEQELQEAEQEFRQAKATRRVRRRRLIIDQQIELTDLEMRCNFSTSNDLCVVRGPAINVKRPTAEELLTLFPYCSSNYSPKLRELYNVASEAVLERLQLPMR
ncbi:hypothetical protein M3Y94_00350400 [Aphelenchoides besseyi]|nr:hypothetical protein M3Y94_00350400 [Aphelenchoides besseyi]